MLNLSACIDFFLQKFIQSGYFSIARSGKNIKVITTVSLKDKVFFDDEIVA